MKSDNTDEFRQIQASGIILFDENNKVLCEYRSSKKGGFLPGGRREGLETPFETCYREVKEELNIQLREIELVLIDLRTNYRRTSETIHFLFHARLTAAEIRDIKVDGNEVEYFKFHATSALLSAVDERTAKRLAVALESIRLGQNSQLLSNGERVSGAGLPANNKD